MQIVLIVMGVGFISLAIFLLMEQINEKPGIGEKVQNEPARVKENHEYSGETGLIDYDVYIMTPKEKSFYIFLAASFFIFVAYVFYRSIILSVLVTPLAVFYPRVRTQEIIKKRKNELCLQFKEALYALSSSLFAGRSVESAFKESLKDISLIYPDPHTYIIREFEYITRRIEMNETIEDVLGDFAARAHIEDIDNFVDVFIISKRSGGNIVEVIKNTSTIIGDKLSIKQEIDTLLAERKLEQKVLNVMPIAMVMLLSWSTGDYMPLFLKAPRVG
jgi:tight adherence protein B